MMQPVNKILESTTTGASGAPVTVLAFSGDISSLSKGALLEAYHGLDSAISKLLLNFSQVDYINSSGIATVIQLLLEANKSSRIVGIFGLNPHFTKVFKMVGVSKYADLSSDLRSALDKF